MYLCVRAYVRSGGDDDGYFFSLPFYLQPYRFANFEDAASQLDQSATLVHGYGQANQVPKMTMIPSGWISG